MLCGERHRHNVILRIQQTKTKKQAMLLTAELADIAKDGHALREDVTVNLEHRHLPVR